MIFWIFVILIALGILLAAAAKAASSRYCHGDCGKIIDFVYSYEGIIVGSGVATALISGVIVAFMLFAIVPAQVSAYGNRLANEKRYEALMYIYELKDNFYEDIIRLEGFGKKSADKLMQAIEDSRDTTLERFINALSI